MNKLSPVWLSALALASITVQGQVASWNFDTLSTAGNTPGANYPAIPADSGSGSATGLHASPAADWSSPVGNGSPQSFSSNSWSVGDYYQFQVNTSALGTGKFQISWDQTGSDSSPRDFTLEYSDSPDFSSLTTVLSYSLTNDGWTGGSHQAASSRSGETTVNDYSASSAIYFRLVDTGFTSINGGGVSATATSQVDSFSVSFTAVPEPGEYAAMFAGGL
ncbi:MAG TPA: hypothetical protein VMB21_00680, partial [Candidatus Limnocylindria bacterium]|nr:hypothetical protein [Candidatus Limnocylindria bacterium]